MLPSFDVLHLLMGLHSFLIMYDILHYYFHFGPEMQLPIISKLKKNHMKHHFRDSNRGFGVTTTLWDWVFGTQHIL
jgi:4-hydroxysphinganine ceramide fatty acyl 2-hydroxylase